MKHYIYLKYFGWISLEIFYRKLRTPLQVSLKFYSSKGPRTKDNNFRYMIFIMWSCHSKHSQFSQPMIDESHMEVTLTITVHLKENNTLKLKGTKFQTVWAVAVLNQWGRLLMGLGAAHSTLWATNSFNIKLLFFK